MSRALVLNAGASWAAYQIGALRHVVGDRGVTFDLLAGTGIGAMNAAFVACGELGALERLWRRMSVRRLVRPALRRCWLGPLSSAPQRAAIARHVSEERLAERGVRLLVSTMDLRAGGLRVLEYPGAEIPLLDGLMAAVATPGAIAPLDHGAAQLAEGTLVESFLLREVLARAPQEIVAIAVATPRGQPRRRYETWGAVAARALALNLDRDVRAALEHADHVAAVAGARGRAAAGLRALVDERVADAQLARTLRERIGAVEQGAQAPTVTAITPSQPLTYPLWWFPRRGMRAATQLGHRDAEAAFAGPAGG